MRCVLVAALSLIPFTGWTTARAEDPIPAEDQYSGGAADRTLEFDGDSTTETARWYRRGFYRGSYGFRYRPYYSYRPYYYGYSYYSRPFYQPYYRGYSYYYSYRPYYYYRPYSYYSYYSYCGGTSVLPSVIVASCFCAPADDTGQAPDSSRPPVVEEKKTYEYDGGPKNPPPMPKDSNGNKTEPKPTSQPPRPTVPLRGRFVSLPSPIAPEYAPEPPVRPEPAPVYYPAFGDRR